MINWQVLSIPLYGGVDTKTDEALVSTSKVLELENGVFSVKDRRNKRTAITKRNGYLQRNSASSFLALASSDSQLLAFDPVTSLSFSEQKNQFVEGSTIEVLKVKQSDLNRPTLLADGQDTITTNNVRADVCVTGPQCFIRFTDVLTGTVLVSENFSAGETNLKTIACGQYIHLYSTDELTNELFLRVYDTNNITSASPILISGSLLSFYYDVSGDNQKTVVTWVEAGGINVAYYTKIGVQGSPLANGLPAPVTIVPTNPVSWIGVRYLENTPTGDLVYIGWIEDKLEVYFSGLNENFTTNFSPIVFHTGGGTNDPTRALTFVWNGANEIHVFYDNGAVGVDPVFVAHGIADLQGNAVGTQYDWVCGCVIANKSFLLNGVGHVPVYKFSINNVQPTVMVLFGKVDDFRDRYEAVKLNYGEAGPLSAYQTQNDTVNALTVLSETQVLGSKCYFSTLVVTKLSENDNEEFTTLTGTQLVELDSTSEDSYINAPLGKTLNMAGGFLQSYDGKSWVESGFHFYPEIESATDAGTGTGSIGAGTYLYYAVFYWMNEKGEVERSAPSIPVSITLAGTNHSVDVSITNCNLTQKERANGQVKIELYRSLANPPANAPAYLVGSVLSFQISQYAAIVDSEADSTAQNNEILYTTGGVLENIPPNAGNVVDSYKTRLVVNDPKDANLTWISKEYVPGQTVNFNPFLSFRTNDLGGPITGYKQLDDKLLIFKKNLIFFTSGQGPNNTGTDFGLFAPELIASDTGCENHSSIVLTPVGVMFKSAKGFYLMNRSLQLEYIGYDVEIFNQQNVTSAIMVEDRNQVRFLTDSGLTLVYDYLYKQWSTFTNHEGVDAVMWKNIYTYLRNDGAVWSENEGSYLDHNTGIKMKIKTPWIKLVQGQQGQASALGPQSFFRVKRFAILGRYASRHTLQVGVGYDYRPDIQSVFYFDTQERLTGPAGQYGNDAYYGETTPYGGTDGADVVYQFRARTVRQKCESIQFTIEDIPQPYNGESYGITDLSIEVGLKQGINKMGRLKTVPSR